MKKTNKPAILMTAAEYAKHRGVSQQRISALKKRGGLVMKGGKVDQSASDALLDAETAPTIGETLLDAQRRKESSLASLRELELKMKAGQLVDLAETRKLWFEKARAIRDGLYVIPERISHVLASETDAKVIRQLLRAELSQQLGALADALAK